MLIFAVFWITLQVGRATLSPCLKFGDTFGSWYNVAALNQTDGWVGSHFIDNEKGNSLEFSNIWIPNNCSYRRFTNHTIHSSVDHTLKSRVEKSRDLSDGRVEIIFIGDSALRGIVCGIGRILSGSETEGPNKNVICGGTAHKFGMPISKSNFGTLYSVDYGNHLRISFIYTQTFHFRHFDWQLEFAITRKPYAVVFNTGVFDFDGIARSHMNDTLWDRGPEDCNSDATAAIAAQRADSFVNYTMWEMNKLAIEYDVRLLYRNNHHNARFGVLCADELFEALLIGSIYEICDNRRISENIWQSQTYDGFHFDRTYMHDPLHHQEVNNNSIGNIPGQLEIQLSQSLLNAIFYDSLGPRSL